MTAFIIEHWPYVLAALAAIGVGVKAWFARWQIQRALEQQTARAEREAVRADAAEGRVAVAEATAAVVTVAAESREAGHALAEEIAHAAPPDASPAAVVRAVDERVRDIARREGADAGGDRAAAVREPPAAAATRGAGRRVPER